MTTPILKTIGLKTHFFTRMGTVRAVDGVDLEIQENEILGLVGESGCGKSVTALSLMRIVPDPPGKIVGGEIFFKGENLLEKSPDEMQTIRGNQIGMVFQDPLSSLNPVLSVGAQIAEAISIHNPNLDQKELQDNAKQMIERVGIPNASERLSEYPWQYSGGMCQRIMIAMALSCNPSLLIADEPTTNLDVTVQAQILEILGGITNEPGRSLLLITHNLGIIAWLADRVGVMYAGSIVEVADTRTIFKHPAHPYTQALLETIPGVGETGKRLRVIAGSVPNLVKIPSGCRFHPRCPIAQEICAQNIPPAVELEPGHEISCFFAK